MRQLLFCDTLTEFCAIVGLKIAQQLHKNGFLCNCCPFFTQQLHRGNECNKKQAPEGLCNNVTKVAFTQTYSLNSYSRLSQRYLSIFSCR